VNADIIVLVTLPYERFHCPGEFEVVQVLAGSRIHVVDRHLDNGGLEIVGHHAANGAGAGKIQAQLLKRFRGTVVFRRYYRACLETLLGHHGPAYVRAPETFQAVFVNPGNIENLVGDLPQGREILIVENIPFLHRNRNLEAGAAGAQIPHMGIHALHEGVPLGNQLGETGIRLQVIGAPAKENGRDEKENQHHRAIAENQFLWQPGIIQRGIVQTLLTHQLALPLCPLPGACSPPGR